LYYNQCDVTRVHLPVNLNRDKYEKKAGKNLMNIILPQNQIVRILDIKMGN